MGENAMKELLETYSVVEIIVFLVLAAAAVKCVIEFFDWSRKRLKDIFDKEYNASQQQAEINRQFNDIDDRIKDLEQTQTNIVEKLDKVSDNINLLLASDMDDIKMDLTKEHHYYCKQGWIDDYSLECCLKRYNHYKDEGGNSFIKRFIDELHELPNHPVTRQINESESTNA